jgi:hypothetical protein
MVSDPWVVRGRYSNTARQILRTFVPRTVYRKLVGHFVQMFANAPTEARSNT